ncbi:uncharacterized protein LOC143592846 [Bidens hawaiensis]|uniref:uncharacterized protein LOC143592846 n=1 Tax=Bidens hawaiensis TaxID=980011 RepID=UPI0040495DFC
MADFDPPSFSLGFDFDTTTDNNIDEAGTKVEDDVDFETLTVVDSDSDDEESFPKLKRLRRVSSAPVKTKPDLHSSVIVDDDDDINDFSSQEDEHLSTHHHSICNSSKISLKGHGVLTKQSVQRKQITLNGPESVLTSCNKPPFPKPTVSPLRKFQLLDSDSDFDDPFISEHPTNNICNGSKPHCKAGPPDFSLNELIKLNESVSKPTQKDLWEDFKPEKSLHVPTPAFDAFCEEYFSSRKDKSKSESNNNNQNNNQNLHVTNNVIDLDDPRPPAHQYFFHIDPRVQNLVRARLPHFFPLDAANRDSEQAGTSNIDYMGQFSNGEKSKQAARTNKGETSSRKNSISSKSQEESRVFIYPKVSNTRKEVPKDAGKRRVQADGQTSGQTAGAGHWFTNQDGKRVYVSKNGQELMGRPAYMLYRKERGGFKNKKAKKSSTKKK